MKCIVISDTHTLHWKLQIPDGDVLVHAGDALNRGTLEELQDFNYWLNTLPHKHKIVIAGNHDWCFEREQTAEKARAILTAATYLQGSGIEIGGVYFYGSPWQPAFMDWALDLERGKPMNDKWKKFRITDVLIPHGPPLNILDNTITGERVGCLDLWEAVSRVRPKFHVFGHIHESYGQLTESGVQFINACICTERYKPINKPIVFEF